MMPVEVSQGELLREYEEITNSLLRENLILKAALKAREAELTQERQRITDLQQEVENARGTSST